MLARQALKKSGVRTGRTPISVQPRPAAKTKIRVVRQNLTRRS
jgi:hypothetical protein